MLLANRVNLRQTMFHFGARLPMALHRRDMVRVATLDFDSHERQNAPTCRQEEDEGKKSDQKSFHKVEPGALISLSYTPYANYFFRKIGDCLWVTGLDFRHSASLDMIFEESSIGASEQSYCRIYLLCYISAVRSFGKHFINFVEHASGFFYSHGNFFFS